MTGTFPTCTAPILTTIFLDFSTTPDNERPCKLAADMSFEPSSGSG